MPKIMKDGSRNLFRGFIITFMLGTALSIAYVLGVPTVIESKARERLLTAVSQSAPLFGVSPISASFASISVEGLPSALIGLPDISINIKQPSAFFSRAFTEPSDRAPSFQITGSNLIISTGSRSRDEGTFAGNRMLLNPVPYSPTERELSYESLVNYNEAPTIILDSISTHLPHSATIPEQSLSEGFATFVNALTGEGSTRPLTARGSIALAQLQTQIPLIMRTVDSHNQLSLERASLQSLNLQDPLTDAELDRFQVSPLLFTYVLFLRLSAERVSKKLVSEFSLPKADEQSISEAAVRWITYGYFSAQVLGARASEQLAELLTKNKRADTARNIGIMTSLGEFSPEQLYRIGIDFNEKSELAPRDFSRRILKHFSAKVR